MSLTPAANNITNSNVNSSEDDDDFVLISCHNDRNEIADELNDHKIKSSATTLPFQQNIHNENNNTMLFDASNSDGTDRYAVHSLYENEVSPLVTSENNNNNIMNNTMNSEHANYRDNNNKNKVYQNASNSSINSSSSSEFIEICGSTPKRHTMSPSEAERYTDTLQSYQNSYHSYDSNNNMYDDYDYDVYGNGDNERVKDIYYDANTKTSVSEGNPADEEEMCMTRVHSVVCLDTNTQLVEETSSNSHDKLIYRASDSTDHHGNNNINIRSHGVSNQENEPNCHYKETITPHPSAPSESSLLSSSLSSLLSSTSSSISSSESETPTEEQQKELPHITRMRSHAHVTRHRKNANREETDKNSRSVTHKHYAGCVLHNTIAANKYEQTEIMHKLTTSYEANLSIATFVRITIHLI